MEVYYALLYILCYVGITLACFYMISMYFNYDSSRKKERTDLKVSIIIPAYNEEKSIERTIDSAVSLDYPRENLEILIIDDGSKDSTYKLAKDYIAALAKKNSSLPTLKVFTKPNGGKGSALNFGIEKSSGEIIVSMDADTFANTDSLKKMMGYFYSKDVMSVTPTIGIYQPKTIWQRIQQIEYYMSTFMRKSFALLDSMHVTPGAFAAYRKEFFIKHGGYDVGNITEDIEIALRIQSNHYIIENTPEASVYTLCPSTFKQFLTQRKRWYTGYLTNLWKYRHLFTPKYGVMGVVVLPIAIFSLFFGIFMFLYTIFRSLSQLRDQFILMNSINFHFNNFFDLSLFSIQSYFYNLFSFPLFWLSLLFLVFLVFYLYFSRRTMKYRDSLKYNFFWFFFLYGFIYSLFWIISLFSLITRRKVKWR